MKTPPNATTLLALVVKKCAFEMNAHDKANINKALAGQQFIDNGVSGGLSVDGRRICEETARGMAANDLAVPAYLLLAYAWNDVLDWADKQLNKPPQPPKMQTFKKWGG